MTTSKMSPALRSLRRRKSRLAQNYSTFDPLPGRLRDHVQGDILIVQPYVPAYRVAFFEALITDLASAGVVARVAAPRNLTSLQARQDHTVGHTWRHETRGRSLRAGPAELTSYGSIHLHGQFRAVIVPAAATCLDTQVAIWRAGRHAPLVAMWGHVGSYVKSAHPLDIALERRMYRRCDHVFAYTPSGSEQAVRWGVDPGRVTTVMNTVDVSRLSEAMRAVENQQCQAFAARYGLSPDRTACFVGGLDDTKRIDFLAAALDQLWHLEPAFRLLVGGEGAESFRLDAAVARGQVVRLGRVDVEEKALMALSSRFIVNPGRVGLLSIDSLVMGLPILTADGADHAPEVEYLARDRDLLIGPADPTGYAQFILENLETRTVPPSTPPPSLSAMVANFSSGIHELLA